MSANDMLAAQLWPWPDPIIKRDTQGGVIFVNAAFLQTYGGQVTDWHGCIVEGWPEPVPGYAPNRFETRMPSASGEIIYDWLEYVMPDGGALAISRNVTALLIQSPPSDPAMAPMPPVHDMQSEQEANMDQFAEPDEGETDILPVHTHTQSESNTAQALEIETAIDVPADADYMAAPQTLSPENTEPQAQSAYVPAVEVAVETQTEPAQSVHIDTTQDESVVPEETREHERRALPIENEESLLGSNWRDAVIAKAVGSEALAESSEVSENKSEIDAQSAIAAPAYGLVLGPNDTDNAIRVLLAEDNAINALLTRTLLEADGCHVDVVEDGMLAVDAMRVNKYDMILMDMRMPNMDGLEATRQIRKLSNEAKAIPIVALTANAFDDDRNACFDAGMNDFMTKPVSAEELQQMVQTWTKSRETVAA